MSRHRVLMSNLGYARGFNGSLLGHMAYVHRNLWCSPSQQLSVIKQFKAMVAQEKPDLCCLLEIDSGSVTSAGVNQLPLLQDNQEFPFSDVENKYAPDSRLRRDPFTRGKSNGFVAKKNYPYEKLLFTHGTKRLIYKMQLEPQLHVYFTHFSLKRQVRARQLHEIIDLVDNTPGEVLLLGDFNILDGLEEIDYLLKVRPLKLLNDPDEYTFTFHRRKLLLDLCICSDSLAKRTQLRIIPQPFSDHAALMVTINP